MLYNSSVITQQQHCYSLLYCSTASPRLLHGFSTASPRLLHGFSTASAATHQRWRSHLLRSHWLAHPDNTHATTISEHSWWLVSGHAARWLTRCAQTGEQCQQEIRTASRQNVRVRQTEQPKRERFRAGIGPTDRKALVKYVDSGLGPGAGDPFFNGFSSEQ